MPCLGPRRTCSWAEGSGGGGGCRACSPIILCCSRIQNWVNDQCLIAEFYCFGWPHPSTLIHNTISSADWIWIRERKREREREIERERVYLPNKPISFADVSLYQLPFIILLGLKCRNGCSAVSNLCVYIGASLLVCFCRFARSRPTLPWWRRWKTRRQESSSSWNQCALWRAFNRKESTIRPELDARYR